MESQKLTVQEAASKWNVSTRSVFRYIETGRIRGYRVGKLTYVDDELPVKIRAAVVSNHDSQEQDKTLATTPGFDAVGELVLWEYRAAKKRQFRMTAALMACLFTIGLLASGLYVGWLMYQGQGRQLQNTQELLRLEQNRTDRLMDQADQPEENPIVTL